MNSNDGVPAAPEPDQQALIAELRRVAAVTGQPLGKLIADLNALNAALAHGVALPHQTGDNDGR